MLHLLVLFYLSLLIVDGSLVRKVFLVEEYLPHLNKQIKIKVNVDGMCDTYNTTLEQCLVQNRQLAMHDHIK